MTVQIVSDKELSRPEMLRCLDRRRLMAAVADILGLARSQVLRFLKVCRARDVDGLISK